jgi:ATP-dependent helicase/nuclease subunit B
LSEWQRWQAKLDQPDRIAPWPAPQPRPPVAARPRQLSVTRVETWMRDPYGLYAEKVLTLRALDPLDAEPSAADYGTAVHDALDAFVRAYPDRLPEDALDRLLDLGRRAFGPALLRPGVWAFGWPRFRRVAAWFVEHERAARAAGRRPARPEVKGRMTVSGPQGDFIVTAEADRIDRQGDGGLVLVDYKTGVVPSAKQVLAGYAPQLPLEGAILRAGGFGDSGGGDLAALEYWKLGGGHPPAEIKPIKEPPGPLADQALAGVKGLIEAFDNPATPYEARPHPGRAPKHSDYLHLARVKEWATLDGEDET